MVPALTALINDVRRQGEVRMVQNVEHLPAELPVMPLPHCEILEQGQIDFDRAA